MFSSDHVQQRIESNVKFVDNLPEIQQTLLQSYRKGLDKQMSCVKHNQTVCDMIIKDIEDVFDNTSSVFTVSIPDSYSLWQAEP